MKRWKSDYPHLFNKYVAELQDYYKNGNVPSSASYELKYALEIQGKRFKKLGLQKDLHLETYVDENVYSIAKINDFFGGKINPTTKYTNARSFAADVIYKDLNGNIISNQKRYISFCEVIITLKNTSNFEEFDHACSSCGAIGKIKDLKISGCPYCRSKFIVTGEMYPKVVNSYVVELDDIDFGKLKYFPYYAVGSIIFFGVALSYLALPIIQKYMILSIIGIVISSLVLSFLSFIVVYALVVILSVLFSFLQLFLAIPKGIVFYKKRHISKRIGIYDKNFDLDSFEGYVVSIVQNILLNDDFNTIIKYVGDSVDKRFNNLIDLEYLSFMDLRKVSVNKDIITVSIILYYRNTYYKHGKIISKKEKLKVELIHGIEFKDKDDGFSIVQVHCDSCGGSFDASRSRVCPYCHNVYKPSLQDWLVKSIRRK